MNTREEGFKADISKDSACWAYSGTSMVPEKRGESFREGYAAGLAQDYDNLAKYAETEDEKNLLVAEFARYREGYAKRVRQYLAARAQCMSPMITGPANFPTARNEKRFKREQRLWQEASDFRKRALGAITKKLRPELRPIMSGDADAVEALQLKIVKAEEVQARMKEANAIIRKNKKDRQAQIVCLEAAGFTRTQAEGLIQPDYCGRIGFAQFELTNNNANIRRMKERLATITQAKATPVQEVIGSAATIQDDPAANRVRLFFPGKPSEEIRSRLKSGGFRWSPTIGAWQAYRNYRSRLLAVEIAGIQKEDPDVTLARQAAGEMVQEVSA